MVKIKKCGIIFFGALLAGVALFPLSATAASTFKDISAENLHSGTGTLEFEVSLLKEISSDPRNHVLILAVASDSTEHYSIEFNQDQLIARRFFAKCILTAFSTAYDFKVSETHKIKLTWYEESTKFYVDGNEVKATGPLSSDDVAAMNPEIRIGQEENFKITNLRVSDKSDAYLSQKDRDFVRNAVCPNLKQLVEERPQETYMGVSLNHFPDQKARDIVKSYIQLLPEDFRKAIRRVIYVEDASFSKGGEAGLADDQSRSIVLKGSYYSDPNVFFHEAAHLYDYEQKINFGIPAEQSEWAAISGVSCYFKGAKLDEFYERFEKTKVANGILGAQGGQCAFEDLAIWVGAAYDDYLKGKTFADKLDPKSPLYSKRNKQKLDFLLKKGFISRQIYDQISKA
jgi:hypothetical protein